MSFQEPIGKETASPPAVATDADRLEQDLRIRATRTIWKALLPALGICIPLVIITDSGALLPLVALGAASIATIVVWKPAARPQLPDPMYQPGTWQPEPMGSLWMRRRDDFLLATFSAVIGAVLSYLLR